MYYISILKKLILTIIIGAIAGYALLVAVYALPVQCMDEHVKRIINRYEIEGINPFIIEGNMTTRLDNYTDGLMLNGAVYDGEESAVVKAAEINMITVDGKMYYDSLIEKYNNDTAQISTDSYSRYWHGYMILLKPLLLFFDYYQIRVLNSGVQVILLLILMWLFFKNRLYGCMVAWGATWIYWSAFIFGKSLQYSSMYYITVLSLIFMLVWKAKLTKIYPVFFCISGAAVAYFDLLTYPLAGLGMTLALGIVLQKEKNWTELFKQLIGEGFCWGFGYAGMWAGKWIIGTLFAKQNLIKEAILQILYRTSDSASEIGKMDNISLGSVFKQNLTAQSSIIIMTVVAVVLVFNIISLIIFNKRYHWDKVLLVIAVAVIPFAWFLVVKNHSFIHYWMTYRNLGVSVFALGCMRELLKSKN